MKILVFTNLYPNIHNPNLGVFIRNRTVALSQFPDVEIKVVAPVPWFPPIRISEKWYQFSQIPEKEVIDGIEVYHPRYLVTPKIGMSFYGYWMLLGVRQLIRRIHKEFPFDLIDAHFLYPDSYAACLLGEQFACPVVVTARGSDVTCYTQIDSIESHIKKTFQNAEHLIAVSNSLRDIMVVHGAVAEKVSVVSNGIDPERFYLLEKERAREKLGFQEGVTNILSVCSLVKLKGVHLLIEALSQLKNLTAQSFKLFVVGSGPEESRLKSLIDQFELQNQVQLVGKVPNVDLIDWYNAADLFFLGSSREGWPNVVCESLACGTPVVATAVNGIPEILNSEELGIMVKRTPEDFARGILQAYNRAWDRQYIAGKGQQRTWENVANEVHELFSRVLSNAKN
ncbi:glycosyltransferase family 4 protein [Deltaproteobacteria bacterium]|nr:glycosyltransferase family 4 protein [Deltaproteobacteria bacterium]